MWTGKPGVQGQKSSASQGQEKGFLAAEIERVHHFIWCSIQILYGKIQAVKPCPGKCEDLSLICKTQVKHCQVCWLMCVSITRCKSVWGMWGCGGEKIVFCWPSRIARLVTYRTIETLSQGDRCPLWGWHPRLTSGSLMYMHQVPPAHIPLW